MWIVLCNAETFLYNYTLPLHVKLIYEFEK